MTEQSWLSSWNTMPLWTFHGIDPESKYLIKVTQSAERPYLAHKERDENILVKSLVNSSQRVVGYTIKLLHKPIAVRTIDFSMVAVFPETESPMSIFVSSPHLRIVRMNSVYQIVLRHKVR